MLGPERPGTGGSAQRVAAATTREPLDFSPRVVAVPWEVIKVI